MRDAGLKTMKNQNSGMCDTSKQDEPTETVSFLLRKATTMYEREIAGKRHLCRHLFQSHELIYETILIYLKTLKNKKCSTIKTKNFCYANDVVLIRFRHACSCLEVFLLFISELHSKIKKLLQENEALQSQQKRVCGTCSCYKTQALDQCLPSQKNSSDESMY